MITKKGFTLVELTVVLAVFAILIVAGTDFFITAVRNNNRATIENEVRQNASKLLQDISLEVRKSTCIYSQSPTTDTFLLRISDDKNSLTCSVGNRIEYFQSSTGIVTKVATSSSDIETYSGVLTSNFVSIQDCSSPNSSCGTTTCTSGITTNTLGLLASNTPFTINIRAQQRPNLSRSDFCASIKLTDTVAPRVY